MELTEKTRLHLPRTVHRKRQGAELFLDPESPHWVAVDERGGWILRRLEEGRTAGQIIRRYAAEQGAELPKAWLHVHDFLQALLRAGFASPAPVESVPYQGRAAYARPGGLKELWFHTNNICNLACAHCLVSSAPWVRDWGLPTDRFLDLIEEAAAMGVDRFYFTGGEPFMRKDLFALIDAVTRRHKRELIILTNATLLKGERAEALKDLDRQKVRFQVSLDGATPETNDRIRGRGSYEAALEGLRRLVRLGFQTSVATAVTGENLEELIGIIRLAARLRVPTQHLMWIHLRGRMGSGSSFRNGDGQRRLSFPKTEKLIEAARRVKAEAGRLGVAVDNFESIKQRVNARPGVKYDLGNACWDSLCLYSDGTLYPSAALAGVKPLALGSVRDGDSLQRIWERSPVAEAFRQASVVRKIHLSGDPFRYLTGGGDLEHTFWYGLNGRQKEGPIEPGRLLEILSGPDPYDSLYRAMCEDAIWEIVEEKRRAVNRKSGYDAPRLYHAMGDGAIHCATDDLAVTGEIDVRTLHSNCVLAFDVDKPRKLVREFYGKAAETPQAQLCCPTRFDEAAVRHIPKEVIDRFYGCGSPVTLADLKEGETFLDLGSGAGIDVFIAAKFVGPRGRAIGVDMTDEMLQVARQHQPAVARNLGYDAVEFRKGFLEAVPADPKSVDAVTSNCVINLSPDKPKVFAEIWRILRDHGRAVIADIVSERPVPAALKVNPRLWGECIVGALTEQEFLAKLEQAGFHGLAVLKKTHWKTVEGYDFYSVTVRGHKFEKKAGCRFIGQKAVYLGPMKSVIDEEGHLFPRDVAVEVCTDTAAKLSQPPYRGSFAVLGPDAVRVELQGQPAGETKGRSPAGTVPESAECGPGCC